MLRGTGYGEINTVAFEVDDGRGSADEDRGNGNREFRGQ